MITVSAVAVDPAGIAEPCLAVLLLCHTLVDKQIYVNPEWTLPLHHKASLWPVQLHWLLAQAGKLTLPPDTVCLGLQTHVLKLV